MMLILSACSQTSAEYKVTENEITAGVVTEILRACKYPNEKFCEEKCCQVEEKCKNEDFAYMECDLKKGQWVNETYSDSKCTSKCGAFAENIEKSNDLAQEKKLVCDEGWKCITKFERSYRLSNCSFTLAERCDRGCMNDSCISLCNPGDFSCRNGILMVCNEDGNLWMYHTICEYGCQNGQCLDSLNLNQTNLTQTQQSICNSECLSITDINEDPEGNECRNPENESVTFKNNCAFSCHLTGWTVSDASVHTYTFPTFALGSGNSFTLHTGDGTDTSSKLYWNSRYTPCKAVWNNDKDTLYLNTSNGTSIVIYSYP